METIIKYQSDTYYKIPNYNTYYINRNGNILSFKKNKKKILKPSINKDGYERVCLIENKKNKNFFIHVLSAITFLNEYKESLEVNHINGIRNDNRVENLEVCTRSENILHSFKFGKKSNKGEKNPNKKISKEAAMTIRFFQQHKIIKSKYLSYCYNISIGHVNFIKNNKSWI